MVVAVAINQLNMVRILIGNKSPCLFKTAVTKIIQEVYFLSCLDLCTYSMLGLYEC